jgi:hypothetical protein
MPAEFLIRIMRTTVLTSFGGTMVLVAVALAPPRSYPPDGGGRFTLRRETGIAAVTNGREPGADHAKRVASGRTRSSGRASSKPQTTRARYGTRQRTNVTPPNA